MLIVNNYSVLEYYDKEDKKLEQFVDVLLR